MRWLRANASARISRLNDLGSGFVYTPMIVMLAEASSLKAMLVAAHPTGRLGRPDEAAELVGWLAWDRASFEIDSSGPMDGGCMPQ